MSESTKAPKAGPIEDLLETISQVLGTPRSVAFQDKVCVLCSGDASTFKDELCEREHSISGICQGCQDHIFGAEEEE